MRFIQTGRFQRTDGSSFPFVFGYAFINQRQHHISQNRRAGQKVERLKNETDFILANIRQLIVRQFGYILTVQKIFSGCRRVESAQNVHQRGLPRARRPHNGHKFPIVNFKTDSVQGGKGHIAVGVGFCNVFYFNHFKISD